MIIIYSCIIFVATLLGALAGLGGGIIIKPILDFIGFHDILTISFISTTAVFSMSVYAIFKRRKLYNHLPLSFVFLVAIGALLGGYMGDYSFTVLLALLSSSLLRIIQAIILIILLVFVLIYMREDTKKRNVTNHLMLIVIGIILGWISSFLGIGGGPINVAVFVLLFNMDIKEASGCSLITIIFSQMSKLIAIAITTGFTKYDLNLLWYVIPIAIIGSISGSYLHKKMSSQRIQKTFNATIIFIILLNIVIVCKEIF